MQREKNAGRLGGGRGAGAWGPSSVARFFSRHSAYVDSPIDHSLTYTPFENDARLNSCVWPPCFHRLRGAGNWLVRESNGSKAGWDRHSKYQTACSWGWDFVWIYFFAVGRDGCDGDRSTGGHNTTTAVAFPIHAAFHSGRREQERYSVLFSLVLLSGCGMPICVYMMSPQ